MGQNHKRKKYLGADDVVMRGLQLGEFGQFPILTRYGAQTLRGYKLRAQRSSDNEFMLQTVWFQPLFFAEFVSSA